MLTFYSNHQIQKHRIIVLGIHVSLIIWASSFVYRQGKPNFCFDF